MLNQISKYLTISFLALILVSGFSLQAHATDDGSQIFGPDCFLPPKVAESEQTFTQKIDAQFGGLVGHLYGFLFWQPVSFTVTDTNGNPVMVEEAVVNADGRPVERLHLVKEKNGKRYVDKSRSACLDKDGNIQKDGNGHPHMIRWHYENLKTPYYESLGAHPKTDYVLTENGDFFTQSSTLMKPGTAVKKEGIPLVVLVLVFGAVFYTLFYRFVNLRMFKHAIDCVRGVYDNPKDPGEISHFQALTSALSGTVGLGNIAGVAVAVGVGGPGAVFWMVLLGLLGMSSKFHECALGQIYRSIDADGRVFGGPTEYLSKGFKDLGLPSLGKVFAIVFSIFIILGSIGGGNMFQANQSYKALAAGIPFLADNALLFGCLLAVLVGIIIIGGIKRIGEVTEKLVPAMCGIYFLVSLWIILSHYDKVPHVVSDIFSNAFSFQAGLGGFVGVAIQGIRRGVFSNEAGLGSASFAHSAAKTDEPVREGIVALLEPFIDTVVICTMTALVVLITGVYDDPTAGQGVEMTRVAFAKEVPWFPAVLSLAVFLFALSTMITWSYYGEKAWAYLFGHSKKVGLIYKVIFLICIVLGCVVSLGNVIDFTDLVFLSLAIPNILGGIFLSGIVKKHFNTYTKKLKAKEFAKYK